MSVIMLFYIGLARPFKEKFYMIKSIIEESAVFLVNASLLVLAIMDHGENQNELARAKLGDIIVMTNFAFNLIAGILALIEILIRAIIIYQLAKIEKSRGISFWKKIFSVMVDPESLEAKKNPEKITPQSSAPKRLGSIIRKVYPDFDHQQTGSLRSLLTLNNQPLKKLSNPNTLMSDLEQQNSSRSLALLENSLANTNQSNSTKLLSSFSPSSNVIDEGSGFSNFKEILQNQRFAEDLKDISFPTRPVSSNPRRNLMRNLKVNNYRKKATVI